MAIGVIFDFPGATIDQYEEVCRGLNDGQPLRSLSEWPGGGILAHVAGTTPDGLRVVDVWESPEAFQAFGEHMMPLAQKAGIQVTEPTIFAVHNFVND